MSAGVDLLDHGADSTQSAPARGSRTRTAPRALSLFVVLAIAKTGMVAGQDLEWSRWMAVALFWQDALVALGFSALDTLVLRRIRLSAFFYFLLVVYAAANVPVTRLLSSPLTVAMLRAAGGALTDSITHHLTLQALAMFGAVLAAGIFLPRQFQNIRWPWSRRFLVAALVLVAVGDVLSASVETRGLHRTAICALVDSARPRIRAKRTDQDWRASPFPQERIGEDLSSLRGAAHGRNVILILLESTGANYLRPYGAADDPMPNLTRFVSPGVVFENAYAVYPESIKGLFSVLCSRYPSFDTTAEMYSAVSTPSVVAVLRRRGYRTALFHSGRFMYLGMQAIIENRGFERLEDAGAITGNFNSSFGVDEPATVQRMLEWIDTLGPSERFFLTYLPIAGHHPYATPEPGPFPDENEIGRYRNALHFGDAAFGEFLGGLRARGLDNQTLFLLAGDHGEAFGQHAGNFGHTLFIHEENMRVPFFIILPGAMAEQTRVRRVASLLDTAPTILDLLGIASPPDYQGASLLNAEPRMALFYTDYSLSLMGLRDQNWKCVAEIGSGKTALFDVVNDPTESFNLAAQFPQRALAYRTRLTEWSAAQKELVLRTIRSREEH